MSNGKMKIKICGITRIEDARLAIDLGAWALGFICYEKSPRYIDPIAIRAIVDALPRARPHRLVGVFVNETSQRIKEVATLAGLDTVQLHGDELSEVCEALQGLTLWKAFRLKSEDQFSQAQAFVPHVEAFLYDAAVAGQYGGTGHLVDWDLLDKAPRHKPLLVSGGLNAENALAAWQRFQPMALDLSSGVESSPGIKDAQKLEQLFALIDRG